MFSNNPPLMLEVGLKNWTFFGIVQFDHNSQPVVAGTFFANIHQVAVGSQQCDHAHIYVAVATQLK